MQKSKRLKVINGRADLPGDFKYLVSANVKLFQIQEGKLHTLSRIKAAVIKYIPYNTERLNAAFAYWRIIITDKLPDGLLMNLMYKFEADENFQNYETVRANGLGGKTDWYAYAGKNYHQMFIDEVTRYFEIQLHFIQMQQKFTNKKKSFVIKNQ